ncbi:MAG: VOC family protein [Halobacteriaceae archaeon]
MAPIDAMSEIILYVEDIDRMVAFYEAAFGLEQTGGAPEHGFVRFDTGDCELCLHAGRDGDVGEYAPKVVFAVEDLEAARSHLESFDVELGEVRTPTPDTRVVDGVDPEGNRFAIEA